jgi:1,4-alpha-glucan branching enzyme
MGWMNDFLGYMQKDPIYRKYHHNSLTFSMIYAYTEKFILILSHDEVVHGKKSLINKMPGDIWQKFANLRLVYGFTLGHPGKKLSFMGNEFAQFDEWSEEKSLDWHLLKLDLNKNFFAYIKDINDIYLREECLWNDFDSSGFRWINCDDSNRSVVAFFRRKKEEKKIESNKKNNINNDLIFIYNFTPVPLLNHRIGVPFCGIYKEILNSDDSKYGGSGIINTNIILTDKINYDNYDQSLKIKLPPLGFIILKQLSN